LKEKAEQKACELEDDVTEAKDAALAKGAELKEDAEDATAEASLAVQDGAKKVEEHSKGMVRQLVGAVGDALHTVKDVAYNLGQHHAAEEMEPNSVTSAQYDPAEPLL
jgi:hypothetical protein